MGRKALLHRWHKAMDETHRVIRIVFLDFRKAFDLIDHNKLLENMCNIGVRPALVKWFATFLKERSHFTKFGDEQSEFEYINGGVPQGSKIGPVAFVVHINNLPEAINEALKIRPPCEWENEDYVVIDDVQYFLWMAQCSRSYCRCSHTYLWYKYRLYPRKDRCSESI